MSEKQFMDNQTTLALLKQELNQNPANPAAASAMGNYYFDEKNAYAAIVYYQLSLQNKPEQPSIMTDMATMYWQVSDVGLAEYYFNKVIEQFPDFGNAYINLGLLYFHAMSDVDKARSLWEHLLTHHAQHPAAAKAKELIAGL